MSGHDISKLEKTNEDIYLLVRFYVKTLAYYQDRFNCICFFLVSVIGEISVHPNKGYSLLQYCARTAAHSTYKLQSFVSVIVGLCFTVVLEFGSTILYDHGHLTASMTSYDIIDRTPFA